MTTEIDDALVYRFAREIGIFGPTGVDWSRRILTAQATDPTLLPYPTMTVSNYHFADWGKTPLVPYLVVPDPPKPEPVMTVDEVMRLAERAANAEYWYRDGRYSVGIVNKANQDLRRAVERLAGGE